MRTALLFPGQGSLTPGSRQVVVEVWPELLDRCAELLGEDPFAGARASTRVAQPAILCASLAGWRLLGQPEPDATAGHSLGELGALVASGALSVDDALWLVCERGRLMARAAERAPGGGMLALLRATPEQAKQVAVETGVVVANDNAPGQLVLSGPSAALSCAGERARELGLRPMELDVAGSFHSPAMEPARAPFLRAARSVALRSPRCRVLSALTAAPFTDVARELADALVGPVRWRETVEGLAAEGIGRFVDVGPGRVLAGLVRRIAPDAEVVAAEELGGVRA